MPRLFLVLEPHDSLPLDTFNSFCYKKLSSKKNRTEQNLTNMTSSLPEK